MPAILKLVKRGVRSVFLFFRRNAVLVGAYVEQLPWVRVCIETGRLQTSSNMRSLCT